MAAAITARTGAGTVVKAKTAVHVEVTGTAPNEMPAGTEKRYYLLVDSPAGVDDARSHVFQTSADGKHVWDDYIFPAAGAYTIRLKDMLDDSDEATLAVTVDAA